MAATATEKARMRYFERAAIPVPRSRIVPKRLAVVADFQGWQILIAY